MPKRRKPNALEILRTAFAAPSLRAKKPRAPRVRLASSPTPPPPPPVPSSKKKEVSLHEEFEALKLRVDAEQASPEEEERFRILEIAEGANYKAGNIEQIIREAQIAHALIPESYEKALDLVKKEFAERVSISSPALERSPAEEIESLLEERSDEAARMEEVAEPFDPERGKAAFNARIEELSKKDKRDLTTKEEEELAVRRIAARYHFKPEFILEDLASLENRYAANKLEVPPLFKEHASKAVDLIDKEILGGTYKKRMQARQVSLEEENKNFFTIIGARSPTTWTLKETREKRARELIEEFKANPTAIAHEFAYKRIQREKRGLDAHPELVERYKLAHTILARHGRYPKPPTAVAFGPRTHMIRLADSIPPLDAPLKHTSAQKNFRITIKTPATIWNIVETILSSEETMGKEFTHKFSLLPRVKQIFLIYILGNYIETHKEDFAFDPQAIKVEETIDFTSLFQNELLMLELIAKAQEKDKSVSKFLTDSNQSITDIISHGGGKTPSEKEINLILFGEKLPSLATFSAEEEKLVHKALQEKDGSPAANAPDNSLLRKTILYASENTMRTLIGFTLEEYMFVQNLRIKFFVNQVPERVKAEIIWGSLVRPEFLDVPRHMFEKLVDLAEILRSYSTVIGKGAREMTIQHFLTCLAGPEKEN